MRRHNIMLSVLGLSSLIVSQAQAAVGRTPGQFSVSSTGSANYTIPIWTPPGPKGIEPHLALVYNSNGGDGIVGHGWSLAGMSSIERCNRTVAQDGFASGVTLGFDVFCLDGRRLRLVSGSQGTPGSTYQSEVADFSLISASTASVGSAPESFTVRAKNGLIYEYGTSSSARVLSTGTSQLLSWMLNKVSDRAGNTMIITYRAPDANLSGSTVPDTISWTPSSYGSTSYNYTVKFNYVINNWQTSINGYVAGTSVLNQYLLSDITISNSSTSVIKYYALSYDLPSTTNKYRLTQVKECADTAQSNCLSPTIIGYQNGQQGVQTTPSTTITGSFSKVLTQYDFNGDGIRDLAYYNGSSWYVAFGSVNGLQTPINTGITYANVLPGAIYGKGIDSFLSPVSSTWYVYTWNGSAFSSVSTGLTTTDIQGFTLADVDADGRDDIVYFGYQSSGVYATTRPNTSSGTAVSFGAPIVDTDTGYLNDGNTSTTLFTPGTDPSAPRKLSFVGDRRDDVVISMALTPCYDVPGYGHVCSGTVYHLFALIPHDNYKFTMLSLAQLGSPAQQSTFKLGNFNSDRCTDIYINSGSSANWNVSGCNGSFPQTIPATIFGTIDWNSDGFVDSVIYNNLGNLSVQLSTGTSTLGQVFNTSIPFNNCVTLRLDVDGDGLDDIGCWNSSGITVYRNNGITNPPDLMTSVTDGFGNNFSPSYASIARSNYSMRSDGVYPDTDYSGPMYVVSQLTATDGAGANYTQSFQYYGARMNEQGRGFDGFAAKRTYDSRSQLYDYQYFRRDFPYTGQLEKDELFQSDGTTLIRRVTNTFASTLLEPATYNLRQFPYVNGSTVQQYEVGGSKNAQLITTSTTGYTFDSYGNATNVITTVTDNDSISPNAGQQWSSTTATAFSVDSSTNWCLGLPTQSTVTNTAPGVVSLARTTQFNTLDYTNCRYSQKVTAPGNSTYQVTENYGFDSFGNVNSVSVTGAGMAARSASINYGTTGQFPMSITNALNQPVNKTYDFNLGVQLSETDANNLTMSWLYDAFGRKTQETRADNTRTTWAYNSCPGSCPSPTDLKSWVQQIERDSGGTAIRESRSFFDGVDRLRFTQQQMLDGSFVYQVHRGYDSLGRTVLDYVPSATENDSYHWIYYDAVNRPIVDTLYVGGVINRQTQIAYGGRFTTVTDPQGKVTTKMTTVAGSLGRSQDHNGYYQNFTYDAFGSLLGVTDSQSNTLFSATYDYGIQAFQRTLNDMDLGARSNTYNALGELTSGSDAKGQSFSMTYDPLSRVTGRSEAEGTTTWTWGNAVASHNIGQLQSVSSPGFSETYSYDSLGRLSNKHTVTDAPYDYDYTYNALGMTDTLLYPTSTSSYRLKLQYVYQYGLLKQVKDANAATVFWQANTMNPRGQITQEALGNGIITNRAFDPSTGMLSSIQAGVGGGAGIQNESYLFDLVGNLTQRQNNTAGFTENFYYDNVYRLDHSNLNGVTNLQMGYDAMGNITSKSDVAGGAAWTYHASKKHAVTQAGNASYTYSYDANGNAQTRNGYSITWNSANYPTVITGPGKNMTFTYDANRQRIAQVYNNGSTTETTQYIGKLLEKVTANGATDWRHYIGGGGGVVAIMSRQSNGTNTTRYILNDHQGSISKITDSAGASFVNENFSAFGARRDGSDWIGDCNCTDLQKMASVTRMGYTGQDMIGGASMGLIHMNGRVQDSITGRFLSADPYISEPGNTQGYNRYSYVMNNPMSFTDPSGFSCQSVTEESSDIPALMYITDSNNKLVYVGPPFKGAMPNSFGCNNNSQQSFNSNFTQSGAWDPNEANRVSGVVNGGVPQAQPSNEQFRFTLQERTFLAGCCLAQVYANDLFPGDIEKQINFQLQFDANYLIGFSSILGEGAIAARTIDLASKTSRELNLLIGNEQRELIREFLGVGLPGVEARAAEFAIPAGLTRQSLQLYAEVAKRAIAEGIDKLGVQEARLRLIERALEVSK